MCPWEDTLGGCQAKAQDTPPPAPSAGSFGEETPQRGLRPQPGRGCGGHTCTGTRHGGAAPALWENLLTNLHLLSQPPTRGESGVVSPEAGEHGPVS